MKNNNTKELIDNLINDKKNIIINEFVNKLINYIEIKNIKQNIDIK